MSQCKYIIAYLSGFIVEYKMEFDKWDQVIIIPEMEKKTRKVNT